MHQSGGPITIRKQTSLVNQSEHDIGAAKQLHRTAGGATEVASLSNQEREAEMTEESRNRQKTPSINELRRRSDEQSRELNEGKDTT